MKINNLKVNMKKIAAITSIALITAGSIKYINHKSDVNDKGYISKSIIVEDNYLLNSEPDIVVIKLEDNKRYVARRVNYKSLTNCDDIKKYKKYDIAMDTYLYFDIFSGDLLSVKLDNEEIVTSVDEKEPILINQYSNYKVSGISEEMPAICYANTYFSNKAVYTKDELKNMVDKLNDLDLQLAKVNIKK